MLHNILRNVGVSRHTLSRFDRQLSMSIVEVADLLPSLADVRVETVVAEDTWVTVRAVADCARSRCPGCGVASGRVHSRYERSLTDPAVGGRTTTIELTVRRFFCDTAECARTTFAEQVAGLTQRHARRSVAACTLLQAVAFALGGRAGARLTGWLGIPTGRMSLLRLIRATPEPAVVAPRILGVDDFAIRRGHVYLCSTWKPAGRSTCCPTGRRTRWRTGYRPIPVWR